MHSSLLAGGLFLLATLPAVSQRLSNNGALISIEPGAQVAVSDDVRITNSGTIDNAGTLTLTGNWNNSAGSGVLTPGTGTVQLIGSSAQQIGGSSVTTFHSLDVSGAGGAITLAADASVGNNAGVLRLGATTLRLNGQMLILNNGASTALSRTSGQLVSETAPHHRVRTVEVGDRRKHRHLVAADGHRHYQPPHHGYHYRRGRRAHRQPDDQHLRDASSQPAPADGG